MIFLIIEGINFHYRDDSTKKEKKHAMTFLRSHEKLKIVIKYSFQTFHKEDGCLPLLISAEYPLEKGMATHSSILAWGSLWAEEPGGLQSMGSQSWTQLSKHTLSTIFVSVFYLN